MMHRRLFAILIVLCCSCSKKDPPPVVPGAATLVFPENNSLCITGVSQSPTTSEVTFSWLAAQNADSYEVIVTALNAGGVQRQITTRLSADFVLDKGAPYSWQVVALNQSSGEKAASTVWQFYNAGAALSYPPFPARLLAPESGVSVFPNTNSQVVLAWELADADNDIAEVEVYLGTSADALPLFVSLGGTAESLQVSVESGSVYYWQILSRDSRGNTSLSRLNSFRVL
jgi:hypothetical protein